MRNSGDDLERVALGRRIGEDLALLRERRPLVQNITNFVSMDIIANALLALGASPAMVHAPEELDEFGKLIGALVVNIGTLSAGWVESMSLAARFARERGKPWVLDPVGAGATAFRDRTVAKLLEHRPSLVRGNASEIMAVAATLGFQTAAVRGKGVDSENSTDEAADVAAEVARRLDCVVVATGATDLVTDGTRTLRFSNGSELMTRVTAIGCSLSAVCGAFCAVTVPFRAACAAVSVVGVAGEMAEQDAALPGSFRVAFIDRLASVGEADLLTRLVVA